MDDQDPFDWIETLHRIGLRLAVGFAVIFLLMALAFFALSLFLALP